MFCKSKCSVFLLILRSPSDLGTLFCISTPTTISILIPCYYNKFEKRGKRSVEKKENDYYINKNEIENGLGLLKYR